ncbi:MAG TPA: phosphate ABC transporter permease PstA [bacterium]|nr:phosphate ABC transporter permease PstA [bacterium]
MKKLKQNLWFWVFRICNILILIFFFLIFFFIFIRGFKVINLEFLFSMPKEGMTKGGIFPAILGTIYLVGVSIIFSLILGIGAGIYLSEYARDNYLVRIIKIGINNLAGVPSIIFGLFGFAVFVKLFKFGVSILSGGLTLGILTLPTIIMSTEEALKSVPQSFREASFSLGARKWQTIKNIVLPNSISGILTGAILSIGRAAGETAPILFTAVTFYINKLPKSIFDEVQALPYHIYGLMTEGTQPEFQVPIAYGTALVLLFLVLGMNSIAIFLRIKTRGKKKW